MFGYKKDIKMILLIFSIIFILSIVFLYKRILIYKYSQELKENEKAFGEEKELKERIGQMIMIGFRGTEISEDSYIVKAIKDIKIGGVILFDFDIPSKSFPRNILNPEQTKKLIFDLQGYSSTSLFVAVDAEGGKINRLKPEYGFSDFLSPKELGEIGDTEITRKEALKLSQELKNLGFNMNLAPVVDVNINSNNPVIGALGRSFSSDPQKVALHAQAFIEAHNQNNVITVAKHFPGHGSSSGDSHLGMVDVTETYKEEEIIPYKILQDKGLLNAVMTAHIFNRKIDKDYPATLSSIFLTDILRKEIGFKGIIISDDMQMEAITNYYGIEEAIIKAINSGGDIVLFSNNSPLGFDEELPYKVQGIIYQAVKNGKIPEERIIESSNRIYNLKKEFKIIQ
jgi:beta-N-acetylhexosaminidase